jgi:hypothetical protein
MNIRFNISNDQKIDHQMHVSFEKSFQDELLICQECVNIDVQTYVIVVCL